MADKNKTGASAHDNRQLGSHRIVPTRIRKSVRILGVCQYSTHFTRLYFLISLNITVSIAIGYWEDLQPLIHEPPLSYFHAFIYAILALLATQLLNPSGSFQTKGWQGLTVAEIAPILTITKLLLRSVIAV